MSEQNANPVELFGMRVAHVGINATDPADALEIAELFSTIIGWGLYGSRFVQFLFRSNKVVRPFLVIYSFVSILGATLDLGLLWDIADTFNGLMSIPNLIALLLLSGMVVKLTKEHFPGKGAVRKTGE